MRARATAEPGGQRMRQVSTLGGVEMAQYLDPARCSWASTLPERRAFPPGTRWLRFDLDELLRAPARTRACVSGALAGRGELS
jgi:hypothetical protein